MGSQINRRSFLKSAAIGAGGLIILKDSRSVLGYPANEKVNIALVGVAGRGSWFVNTMENTGANVVAMCDVNDKRFAGAFEKISGAKKYYDFRKMLDEMDKQIDGITVATPDNTHAVISAAAIRAGKGVLCEKPLVHNVFEARKLRTLARECKVATQMGNQGTASRGFREAVDIIWAGTLGTVREVHVWNTGGGAGDRRLPEGKMDVPDFIKWDLWLGPAAARDYHSGWMKWHTWRDFATGNLGNWSSHTMNVVFKGLKINRLWEDKAAGLNRRKIKVQAEVSGIHTHTFPRWETIRFDVPPRADMPKVRINWYNGGGKAPAPRELIEQKMERRLDWGDAGARKYQDHAGCLLVGTKGMLHSNGHNTIYSLHPAGKFKDFKLENPTLPRSRGHEREWINALKGGDPAMSNFDYSGPLTEFNLLGNIATQIEGPIEFDPITMKIVNNEQADGLIYRKYRKGWVL